MTPPTRAAVDDEHALSALRGTVGQRGRRRASARRSRSCAMPTAETGRTPGREPGGRTGRSDVAFRPGGSAGGRSGSTDEPSPGCNRRVGRLRGRSTTDGCVRTRQSWGKTRHFHHHTTASRHLLRPLKFYRGRGFGVGTRVAFVLGNRRRPRWTSPRAHELDSGG